VEEMEKAEKKTLFDIVRENPMQIDKEEMDGYIDSFITNYDAADPEKKAELRMSLNEEFREQYSNFERDLWHPCSWLSSIVQQQFYPNRKDPTADERKMISGCYKALDMIRAHLAELDPSHSKSYSQPYSLGNWKNEQDLDEKLRLKDEYTERMCTILRKNGMSCEIQARLKKYDVPDKEKRLASQWSSYPTKEKTLAYKQLILMGAEVAWEYERANCHEAYPLVKKAFYQVESDYVDGLIAVSLFAGMMSGLLSGRWSQQYEKGEP
jgi:hypothetical protein